MCRRRDNIINCRGGFTLVELLVVIAIIALLMSILMPALGRTRRQAQAVLCQSHLHAWGLAFQMFTDDHDGYFPASHKANKDYWIVALLPYIGAEKNEPSESRETFFCPSAKLSKNIGYSINHYGTTSSAWGPFPMSDTIWYDAGAMGSYGFNDWCANPPSTEYWSLPSKYSFRTPNVARRKDVPVLMDALYCDGFPMSANIPPPYPDVYDNWYSNAMQIFCIDRHGGGMNGVFIDWSVRKIGLKELWQLKWHKAYDTDEPAPDWESEAPWMRKLKNY